MLSLGALADVCDKGECSGKKSFIGRRVKDQKNVAEG